MIGTSVAFFIFNRPDTTRRVFQAIAKAKPSTLLLVGDGPRSGRIGEYEACRKVREIVSHVDWPCEVITNFSDENRGCRERVISGLDWVFSLVDEAIILEDDCLPDPSFFPFCQELLEKYRNDDRIAYISGANLLQKYVKSESSYFFSEMGGIWGWATWRSEWHRYDRHLTDWPQLRSEKMLSEIFGKSNAVAHWTAIFDAMYEKRGPDTWDYQWLYTCLKNHSLAAVASLNLISNIGFGANATHTTHEDPRLVVPASSLQFPLKHPASFIPLRSIDQRLQELYTEPILRRVFRRIGRLSQPNPEY